MASDPSEFGDEAAGDELGRVSAMVRKGVETVGGGLSEGAWVKEAMEVGGER
jgi:hypothetical protein